MAIETALRTADRGREANEGLRVGLRIRRIPPSRRLNSLFSRTEEIIINRPLDVVLDAEAKTSLERTIDRNTSLPGVSGTHMLTGGDYGPPGSRRLTCLTDGSTLVEEVLENVRDKNSAQFRYVVWNYTSEKGRPIVYGVGHFVRTDLGSGRTRVQWTYSFQLNRRRFPGDLGRIWDFLFRIGFLDREYAEMMRRSLAGSKARTEGNTPVVASWSNKVGRGVLCYVGVRLEGYRNGSPQFH